MTPDARPAPAAATRPADGAPGAPAVDPAAAPPVGDPPRERRLRLDRGEVHRFVHESWRRVTGDPAVPAPGSEAERTGLAAGLIQALVALRLAAAARHVLSIVPAAATAAEAVAAAGGAGGGGAGDDAVGSRAAGGRGDAAALDARLAALPDGRLDRERFDRTFAENLAVLAERHPDAAARLGPPEAIRARRDRLEVHRDAAGLVHVLDLGDAAATARAAADPDTGVAPRPRPRWVGGFVDRRAERGFEAPRAGAAPARLLVVGLGTGRLVDRIVATSATPPGTVPVHVHVVEPDVDALLAWLSLADRRATLADPRLMLFTGPSAIADWRARLEARPGLPVPNRIVVADPDARADVEALAAARNAVTRGRAAAIESAVTALRDLWTGRTDAAAAEAIRPGATVVGFTSRHTTMLKYAMRDVAEAFERLGFRFVIVEEAADDEQLFADQIAGTLTREDAALVVTFNHLRPTAPPLFGDVPVLTLVLDPVDEILSREGAARIGRRDVVCGFYAGRAVSELGYPARRYLPLPFFPVSTRTFHDAPLDAAAAERFDCDVVYVGHARGTPEAWHEHCRRSFRPSIDPLLDAARALLDERSREPGAILHLPQCRDIVDAACARTGIDLPDRVRSNVASMHVHRLHDIRWRREALRWAARWARRTGRRLHLHGEGWAADPELSDFDRGPVARDREARLAYGGARLALQLLPSGLVHQRTFEALCSGTLVVARESPHDFLLGDRHRFRREHGDGADAPSMLYQAGFRSLDELVFADEDELGACLDRWLADDAGRTARSAAMAEIVRARFTWDAVLPRILDGVRAAIGLG